MGYDSDFPSIMLHFHSQFQVPAHFGFNLQMLKNPRKPAFRIGRIFLVQTNSGWEILEHPDIEI